MSGRTIASILGVLIVIIGALLLFAGVVGFDSNIWFLIVGVPIAIVGISIISRKQ